MKHIAKGMEHLSLIIRRDELGLCALGIRRRSYYIFDGGWRLERTTAVCLLGSRLLSARKH